MTPQLQSAPIVRLGLTLAAMFSVGACTPAPIPTPAPEKVKVLSFTASAHTAETGAPVTLSWTTEHATSVSLETLGGETVAGVEELLNGSVEVTPGKNTTYILKAYGVGGSDTRMQSIQVATVAKGTLFTASPSAIPAGGSSTLMWSVEGASTVHIQGESGQTLVEGGHKGSLSVHPRLSTTYTLQAGDQSAQVSVQVEPGILSFESDKRSYEPGDSVTLTWRTGGAHRVTLLRVGRAEALTSLEASETDEVFSGSATDVVPTHLPADGLLRYVLRLQEGGVTLEKTLDVYVGSLPFVEAFEVPPYVVTGRPFTVCWTTHKSLRVQVLVGGSPVYESQRPEEAWQGELELTALPGRADVVLRAINAVGATTETRTVQPLGPPSLNKPFRADKPEIAKGGEEVELSWDIQNARHVKVSIEGGKTLFEGTGDHVAAASLKHRPNGQPTVYVLEADNTLEVDEVLQTLERQTTQVMVLDPVRLQFSPSSLPRNGKTTVTGVNHFPEALVRGLPVGELNRPGEAYIDINATGTPVPITWWDTDSAAVLAELPRDFFMPLFGQQVGGRSLSLSPNGWLVFATSRKDGRDLPGPLPTTNLEPLALAPFAGDLQHPEADIPNGYYVQLDTIDGEDRLIVTWPRIQKFSFPLLPETESEFQAQLYSSGKVVFAYKTMNLPADLGSVGVQNGDRTFAAIGPSAPEFVRSGHVSL